jgi:hypothetical protein
MKKNIHLASSVFASVLMGFCAQNALAVDKGTYVIEDRGNLSFVRENLEIQCRNDNGEVLQSEEVGPRSNVYHEVNGRRKTTVLTVWKVLCRRQHFDGKMPVVVIALDNGDTLSKSTTLEPKVREEILSASAKDDENCASKLVQLVKKLKEDSDVRSASKELEKIMGPFTVAITVDPGTENRSGSLSNLLDTTDFNHIDRISILTPNYEMLGEIDPKWTGADGKANSLEKMDELQHSTCSVDKEDILGLIRRMIKEKQLQKEQESIFSKLKQKNPGLKSAHKPAMRAIASFPAGSSGQSGSMEQSDRSVSASFVDSPALSGWQTQ